MKSVLVLMSILFAQVALSEEWRLLDLERFAFEAYKIEDHRTADFVYADPQHSHGNETWRGGSAVVFDLNLASFRDLTLYLNNRVHGEGTTAQFRQIGWQYELGAHIGPKVDVFWFHHSQHLLDIKGEQKFPLDNFFGFRVNFFTRD